MHWFLIYYLVDGIRNDFACVFDWSRRYAYLEVCRAMANAVTDKYGPGHKWTWDSEEFSTPKKERTVQVELTDEERAFVVLAVHSFTTLTPSLRGLFQKVELTKKLGIESMEDFQAFSDRVLAKLTS